MKKTNNSINGIYKWDYTLRNLKSCRHKRNKFSHEVGTTEYEFFNKEDLDFLKEFRSLLLSAQDPLAILESKRQFVINQRNIYRKKIIVEQPNESNKTWLIIFLTAFFIILFAVAVVILFIALRPMLY